MTGGNRAPGDDIDEARIGEPDVVSSDRWTPSFWLKTVRTKDGKPPSTGWVRALDTTDRDAPASLVGTGHGRGALAVAHGGIWVANQRSRTVARLDPRTLELTAIQRFRKAPVALAGGPNGVWAVGANGWLWRLWPDGRAAEGVARLGRGATAIAVAEDRVWVLRRNGRLLGVDVASGEITADGKVPRGATQMVAAERGAIWLACSRSRRVALFDPQAGEAVAQLRLSHRIRCMAVCGSTLFVGCASTLLPRRGQLYAIDCELHQIASTVRLPARPRALAAGNGAVWAACASAWSREGTIQRVDVGEGRPATWWKTDWLVGSLALSEGRLLAAMSLEVAVPVVGEHFGASMGDGNG